MSPKRNTRSGSTEETPITMTALNAALQNLRAAIKDDVKLEIDSLREIIEKQAKEINSLKSMVHEKSIQIEYLENVRRAEYAIIYGVPEEGTQWLDCDTLDDKVKLLLSDDDVYDRSHRPVRLGKPKSSTSSPQPRPVKIKFTSENSKKAAINHFRNPRRNLSKYP